MHDVSEKRDLEDAPVMLYLVSITAGRVHLCCAAQSSSRPMKTSPSIVGFSMLVKTRSHIPEYSRPIKNQAQLCQGLPVRCESFN